MSLPTSEPLPPDDSSALPPARRRRQRRLLAPDTTDEQTALLEQLVTRLTPSVDFLVFSFICGLIAGIAALANTPALFCPGRSGCTISIPGDRSVTGIHYRFAHFLPAIIDRRVDRRIAGFYRRRAGRFDRPAISTVFRYSMLICMPIFHGMTFCCSQWEQA